MSRGNDDVSDRSRVDDFTALVERVGQALGGDVKCVRSIVVPMDDEDFAPYVGYEARREGVKRNVTWSFSGPAICDTDMVLDTIEPLFEETVQ